MPDETKSYCWRSDCKASRTGFNVSDWPVCSTCKCELTESMYDRIKLKNEEDNPIDPDKWGSNLDSDD